MKKLTCPACGVETFSVHQMMSLGALRTLQCRGCHTVVRGHRGHLVLLNVLMFVLFALGLIVGGYIGGRVPSYPAMIIVGAMVGGVLASLLVAVAYARYVPMLIAKTG